LSFTKRPSVTRNKTDIEILKITQSIVIEEFEKDIIEIAKKTAVISTIIGSSIFFIFLFLNIESVAYIGFLFVLFASIANGIVLIQLTYLWFSKTDKRKEVRNVILLVLINIPIALIYIKIGGILFRSRFGI
jgi:hypothetical protein